MTMRHSFVAEGESSILLVIDVQEGMLKVMNRGKECIHRVNQLLRAARLLDIPVVATEQYPRGLGGTVDEVKRELDGAVFFHKEHFSACLEDGFLEKIRGYGRPMVVIAGMETHVCVLQTALDLMKSGFRVHVAKNAVASRYEEDRETALDLMRDAGAVVSTVEIVIFQWARRANTEKFRKLLPIVK